MIHEEEGRQAGEADDRKFACRRASLAGPEACQRIPSDRADLRKESGPPRTTHDSGRDIPLDGGRADIKNEKEGMKYIRFPGRNGASRWRIDETEDPGSHLRRLLRGRRLLRMDVCGGLEATGLVPRGHHALDLHDVHARRGDLPRRARWARPED